MIYYIVKVLLSSIIIVVISEMSKRSSLIASILASLPLLSLMAIIWIYIETKDLAKISEFSQGIFWLVVPSLLFFILLPLFLKNNINFWLSLGLSIGITIAAYFLMLIILKKTGMNI